MVFLFEVYIGVKVIFRKEMMVVFFDFGEGGGGECRLGVVWRRRGKGEVFKFCSLRDVGVLSKWW